MDRNLALMEERKINVAVDAPFEEVLGKLKKADLKRITDSHGLARTASLTKSRLNARISESLGNTGRLAYILYGMDDLMLADFTALAKKDFLQGAALKGEGLSPLLDLGYVYAQMNDGDTVLVMPQAVKDAYKAINQKEFKEAKARFDLVYDYLKGAVNLYGICTFPHVAGLLNQQHDLGIDAEEALNILICKMTFQPDVVSYGPLMVHPALIDGDSDEGVKTLASVQGDKPKYMPTADEILSYAKDTLSLNEELMAVQSFLETAFPSQDCHAITEEIAMAFPYGFTPKAALVPLQLRGLELDGYGASQQFFTLVQGAYLKARTWENRGFTSQEAVGSGHSQKPVVIPSLAPIQKEKIGRNDLCPCGSGKKFKKCCN